MRASYSCLFTLLILILLSSCNKNNYSTVEGFALGTTYRVVWSDTPDTTVTQLINNAFDQINNSLSVYLPTSLISQFNREGSVEADTFLLNVYRRSLEIYKLSDGAFDVSASPLFNIWGFGFAKRQEVTQEVIDSAFALVGMEKVYLDGNRLVTEIPGFSMNFNAIAKGYTSDVVAQALDRIGVKNYLVEIGGEIVCKGKNREGKGWSIGIDKPFEGNIIQGADIQDVLVLNGGALATSGNYRSFYKEGDEVLSHTIDPKTGHPVRHSLLSATVLAPDAMTADAYATWFMVVGLERAIEIIENDPTIEGYLIYNEEGKFKIYKSAGVVLK